MTAKIMLVEDDTNLSDIYKARFEAEGFQVTAAKDGEEALALAVKEKPELIISDIMMPKISGFDMLDILRSTESIKYTKVIMMTALGQAEDKARAEKLGADRYLVKSQVTLEDVVRAVHEVLGQASTPPPTAAAAATGTPATAATQTANSGAPSDPPAATSTVTTDVPEKPQAERTVVNVPVATPSDNAQPTVSVSANDIPSISIDASGNPTPAAPADDSPSVTLPTSDKPAAPNEPAATKATDGKAAALDEIRDFVNKAEASSQAKADDVKAIIGADKAKSLAADDSTNGPTKTSAPADDLSTDHVSIVNKKVIKPPSNIKPKFDLEQAEKELALEENKEIIEAEAEQPAVVRGSGLDAPPPDSGPLAPPPDPIDSVISPAGDSPTTPNDKT